MKAARFAAGVALVVAIGLGLFAYDFPRPLSDDMAPTLRTGDVLMACRLCTPARGDVVVFADEGGQLSMRRVVALPGEKVDIVKGRLVVDGRPIEAAAAGTLKLGGVDGGLPQLGFAVVEEALGGHHYRVIADLGLTPGGRSRDSGADDGYFLLADRRTLVRDSRDYGPIPRRRIRSVVKRILLAGDGDGARQTAVP